MRFIRKGKLRTRNIGPYRIIRGIDQMAYEIELSPELMSIHLVSQMSMLWKCVGDPSRIVPTRDVEI